MLPLYYYAEKLQLKERNIQAKMKPKLDEYKGVFKGNELFLYTKNLYRQYDYRPYYALRSLVGVIFQVPFFIAAYHLFMNLSELNDIQFLFINDLSLSDKLLTISNMEINVLPILMTIINLSSAFVYGKQLSKAEKRPIFFLSFLFLILLYTAPSGLIIYWTFNNIFSLLKNAYTSKRFYRNNGYSILKDEQ